MIITLRRVVPCLVLSLLALPAQAAGELEVRWWAPDLSTSAAVDGLAFDPALDIPTSLDLELDADEELEARLTLRSSWGLFVRAAYQNVGSAGSTDVALGVVGLPIDLTARLDTQLDFEYGRLAVGWIFGPPDGPINGGVFVEAKGVRGDVALTASALGVSAGVTDDFEAAVPAAGALLRAKVHPRVELFGELSVAVDSDEADVTDYEVGGRFIVTDGFAVGAGYRSLEIDGVFDAVTVDFQLDGVFASAVLRW